MRNHPEEANGKRRSPSPEIAKQAPAFNGPGQIRLAELSVFNWGTFNGLHTARIDPVGTLITGDNGSGKTTLIDGLMALLLPAGKATFNVAAAQGDRTDRSLLSYMRGSYGSAHDGSGTRTKSKRESAVVTGLRALYRGDDGSEITLAALFWTTQATNALADVKRVYAVARRDMALKEMLDAFGDGNSRALKQWLRDDPPATCCDDNHTDFRELYRKLLFMENKNAPALLSRALGLKKIDDLTKLIRELVLEPSSVKNDARKVVEEFADLDAVHDELVDTRKQRDQLIRLPELDQAIRESSEALAGLSLEKENLPIYLGEVFGEMWRRKISEIEEELQSIALEIKETEVEKSEGNALVERRHGEYLRVGGDRTEQLKRDMKHAQDNLERVARNASEYQNVAGKLELPHALDRRLFMENQSRAGKQLTNLRSDTETYQDRFAEISGEFSKLQSASAAVSEEIREMEARPESNIELRYQRLREELTSSLNLDKKDFMFFGELIDVKDGERDWQGAIERALGGLRTTLAVPGDTYSMVTKWLNARHTGLHVRVQVVGDTGNKTHPAEFKKDGFLRKLRWREHPYRDWLKRHLAKFDLSCVAGTEELDRTPHSMTRQGLIHMRRGRFEKKDMHAIDNRRKWYLGFSNKSRLAILNTDKRKLEQELADTAEKVSNARQDLESMNDVKKHWETIRDLIWEDIDAPFWRSKREGLKKDILELEKSGGDLEKARTRWEASKKALEKIQETLKELFSKQGNTEAILESAREEEGKARVEAEKGVADFVKERLGTRVGPVRKEDLNRRSELSRAVDKELDRELENERSKKSRHERIAVGIISAFRANEKWRVLTIDWPSDLRSLPDYLHHLAYLENEGLPDLVERFVERLNKHATQSLAGIGAKLEAERDDIIERIDTINNVLKRTEFMPGSYLKLGSTKEMYPHVRDFETRLRGVLSGITSDDHEARYCRLSEVVEILDKASAPGTSSTLESMRLLDPRYQMSFYAEEIDAATGALRDVLKSSSGKSGGEKESFAGTIVAASLAYVLTPGGHDRPVYSTVFLDEAFSNTAEAVSRRVLRVFKELHIHANLITPYKNLNLARESARSLLIVERDQEHHDSRFCEVTWEEIDRMNREKSTQIVSEAEQLGIELDVPREVSHVA